MFVDKLLVKGGLSFAEMLAKIEEQKKVLVETGVHEAPSTDFKNVSIIKKHLKYRASKGWIFTLYKNGKVKATDYSVGGDGTIIDKAAEEVEEPAQIAA